MLYNKDILPSRGHYLVLQHDDDAKTKAGLHLPRGAGRGPHAEEEVPRLAIVTAVGATPREDGNLIEPEYVIGDVILFRSYACVPIIIDGQKYALVPFGMALGKVLDTTPDEEQDTPSPLAPPPPNEVL